MTPPPNLARLDARTLAWFDHYLRHDGAPTGPVFRVTRTGGDMRLGDDPELQAGDPENRYQPEWVPLSTLATMPVRPASILPTLLSLLWSQTDTDPKVLADLANASDEAYQES